MTDQVPKRPSERIEAAAEKVESAAGTVEHAAGGTWRSVRWLFLLVFIVGVMVGGLIALVTRLNDRVDDVSHNVERNTEQIGHLEEFVDELETSTPEEQLQEDAIARAVAIVPSIREILCDPEAFGHVRGCQVQP